MTRRGERAVWRGSQWIAMAAVVALAIGTGALALYAYEHANPAPVDATAAPAPALTPSARPSTASPSATPEATTGSPTIAASTTERFLAIGSRAWWRASSDVCGGPEPLLERSIDQGLTWVDVTPRYLDVRQIMSLDPFDATEAEMVTARGDGCEVHALRTFTQGEFWDSYPAVLQASSYLDQRDPSTVIVAGSAVAAPCADPSDVRETADIVTAICDGGVRMLADGAWQTVPVDDTVAVASDGTNLVFAHIASDCAGTAVSQTPIAGIGSLERIGCSPAQASAETAIATSGDRIVLWSGDEITVVR